MCRPLAPHHRLTPSSARDTLAPPKGPKVFGEPLYFLRLLMKLKVSLRSYGHTAEVMLSFLQGFSQCCFSCSTQSGITVAYQLTLYGESVWIIAFGWWNCL